MTRASDHGNAAAAVPAVLPAVSRAYGCMHPMLRLQLPACLPCFLVRTPRRATSLAERPPTRRGPSTAPRGGAVCVRLHLATTKHPPIRLSATASSTFTIPLQLSIRCAGCALLRPPVRTPKPPLRRQLTPIVLTAATIVRLAIVAAVLPFAGTAMARHGSVASMAAVGRRTAGTPAGRPSVRLSHSRRQAAPRVTVRIVQASSARITRGDSDCCCRSKCGRISVTGACWRDA